MSKNECSLACYLVCASLSFFFFLFFLFFLSQEIRTKPQTFLYFLRHLWSTLMDGSDHYHFFPFSLFPFPVMSCPFFYFIFLSFLFVSFPVLSSPFLSFPVLPIPEFSLLSTHSLTSLSYIVRTFFFIQFRFVSLSLHYLFPAGVVRTFLPLI